MPLPAFSIRTFQLSRPQFLNRIQPTVFVFAIFILIVSIPFLTKSGSEWDTVYVPTAGHLLAGESIYEQVHGFVYPPFSSLLAVPVANSSHIMQRLYWFAINICAIAIAIQAAWSLAHGPEINSSTPFREKLAAGLGTAVGLTYFLNSLMHQQTDVLLAALVLSGCQLFQNERIFAAASAFGLAAAMKCTPLLFAPYLLVRGRFLAAACMVLIAIGANLIPDLIHRPAHHSTWLSQWYSTYLAPMASPEHRPGEWGTLILYNQSFAGGLNRWTGSTWEFVDRTLNIQNTTPTLSSMQQKQILLILALSFGFLSLIAMAVARYRKSLSIAEITAVELAIVCCGMLLFSPMSGTAHFGLLILPAYLMARSALVDRQWPAGVLFGFILLAAIVANKDLAGKTIYTLSLWYGVTTISALACFTGCILQLLKRDVAADQKFHAQVKSVS